MQDRNETLVGRRCVPEKDDGKQEAFRTVCHFVHHSELASACVIAAPGQRSYCAD